MNGRARARGAAVGLPVRPARERKKLLVAEGFDGAGAGGAPRRHEPEEDADAHADDEGQHDGARREVGREHLVDAPRRQRRERHADDAAHQAHQHGLGEPE